MVAKGRRGTGDALFREAQAHRIGERARHFGNGRLDDGTGMDGLGVVGNVARPADDAEGHIVGRQRLAPVLVVAGSEGLAQDGREFGRALAALLGRGKPRIGGELGLADRLAQRQLELVLAHDGELQPPVVGGPDDFSPGRRQPAPPRAWLCVSADNDPRAVYAPSGSTGPIASRSRVRRAPDPARPAVRLRNAANREGRSGRSRRWRRSPAGRGRGRSRHSR